MAHGYSGASGSSSSSSSSGVVGIHYRVGRKIGEGSFGVIFEGEWEERLPIPAQTKRLILWLRGPLALLGTNLLNSQTVAIKFVRPDVV